MAHVQARAIDTEIEIVAMDKMLCQQNISALIKQYEISRMELGIKFENPVIDLQSEPFNQKIKKQKKSIHT